MRLRSKPLSVIAAVGYKATGDSVAPLRASPVPAGGGTRTSDKSTYDPVGAVRKAFSQFTFSRNSMNSTEPDKEKAKGILRMGQLMYAWDTFPPMAGTEYWGGTIGTPTASNSCIVSGPTSRKTGERNTTLTINRTAKLDACGQIPAV